MYGREACLREVLDGCSAVQSEQVEVTLGQRLDGAPSETGGGFEKTGVHSCLEGDVVLRAGTVVAAWCVETSASLKLLLQQVNRAGSVDHRSNATEQS